MTGRIEDYAVIGNCETMALVGEIFGLRYAATLGGFVFLSHQLGSATGVWLAGRSYAASGSYDTMWFASTALALFAAALAWMIDERPQRGPSGPPVRAELQDTRS